MFLLIVDPWGHLWSTLYFVFFWCRKKSLAPKVPQERPTTHRPFRIHILTFWMSWCVIFQFVCLKCWFKEKVSFQACLMCFSCCLERYERDRQTNRPSCPRCNYPQNVPLPRLWESANGMQLAVAPACYGCTRHRNTTASFYAKCFCSRALLTSFRSEGLRRQNMNPLFHSVATHEKVDWSMRKV